MLLIKFIFMVISSSMLLCRCYYCNNKFIYRHRFYSSKTDNDYNEDEKPIFSFGVISDIQYCDSSDALNFQGTKLRRYRQSLSIFNDAANHWNENKEKKNIKFSIVLGDILDGKCQSLNNKEKCLHDILSITSKYNNLDYHYCFGNHCHYTFNRNELQRYFLSNNNYESQNSIGIPRYTSRSKLYYDYSPCIGWRFISLDSYDISTIGASSEENRLKAHEILRNNNPNDCTVSGGWFKDLPIDKYKFVPYNGGISNKQLQWLDDVITKSIKNNEKVIVFSHQPIHAPDKQQSLIFNSEEIKSILSKGNVICYFAGHDHDGQFDIDENTGTYHIVPAAPIEVNENDTTYGTVSVYHDRLKINWVGKKPNKTRIPWRDTLLLK